ncbi:PmoA family protein [Lysobacter korlensis]|uniref:PmoA family protein n=1 Tax=Lysobacter korlensis TaxID=553636 RepID=A0ABV6RT92_9GAMM
MAGDLSIREEPDALVVRAGNAELARYVFEPDAPTEESPKPFFHPLRTLTGAPLTVYRPWDHRWHKGLSMTWSEVSGENFWGGPTFSRDAGYQWRDNLGSMRHERFRSVERAGAAVSFLEELSWHSSTGERWVAETRSHRFSVDANRALWVLDFTTELVNVRGSELVFGSPTTLGRENAGYTGLFWRGPRSWTSGAVRSSTGSSPDDVMGSEAEWVSFSGEHDELDGGATVIAYAGTSSAAVPIKWFVRAEPFAALAPSPSFDEAIAVPEGGALRLQHRFVFIDLRLDGEELRAIAGELRP